GLYCACFPARRSSDLFMDQFVADVQRAIPDGPQNLSGARESVISSVVSGRWQTTGGDQAPALVRPDGGVLERTNDWRPRSFAFRSEEHTSELQSRFDL